MEIREVRFRGSGPGYRTREVIVATTLLNAERYAVRTQQFEAATVMLECEALELPTVAINLS
jgi:hypothetical protein